MSDSEEEGGFGSDASEDDDEDFGGGFDDEDEDDEEEVDGGFGAEEVEEEEEEESPLPNAVPLPKIVQQKVAGAAFKAFGTKYFKGQSPNYNINPIATPLLNIANSTSAKTAIATFKLVCQFMGITAIVGKSTLNALTGMQQIVGVALKDESLKDEVYCQLMKQWTDNPSPMSRARGTILLGLCLGCFAPSDKLLPVLRQFILEGPKGFIPYCNLLLRRTLHNGVRLQPPCQLELQAVKKKQIMRINVITDLATGDTASARLDPASTSSEWVAEIANQMGIKDTYGWMIYMDRFGTLVSLRGAGAKGQHIMDAVSLCDQEAAAKGIAGKEALSVTGQFSFRKEYFAPDHNSTKDPTATHLLFHQIQFNVRRNVYKCPNVEDYNVLAAQMYYSLYGDDLDSNRLGECLKAWLPQTEIDRQKLKDRLPIIEKLHAKSEYSRRSYTQSQTEGLVVTYALEKWGKVNSFSSDGAMMLMASK